MRETTKNDDYPFRYPVWMRSLTVAGFLAATICVGFIVSMYAFAANGGDGVDRFKLWIIAPVMAMFFGGSFVFAANYLMRTFRSFRVDNEGVHERGLLGSGGCNGGNSITAQPRSPEPRV